MVVPLRKFLLLLDIRRAVISIPYNSDFGDLSDSLILGVLEISSFYGGPGGYFGDTPSIRRFGEILLIEQFVGLDI